MRLVFTIITGLALMGMITTAWYISQATVLALANGVLGSVAGEGLNILHLVEFANIIWGPVFDGVILFWMIASAQARDAESDIYG